MDTSKEDVDDMKEGFISTNMMMAQIDIRIDKMKDAIGIENLEKSPS